MMGLRADVDFVATNANTEKKSTVPDVSRLKERCFGANANQLNAVQKTNCSTVDNAKTFHAISCESSPMIKSMVITGEKFSEDLVKRVTIHSLRGLIALTDNYIEENMMIIEKEFEQLLKENLVIIE